MEETKRSTFTWRGLSMVALVNALIFAAFFGFVATIDQTPLQNCGSSTSDLGCGYERELALIIGLVFLVPAAFVSLLLSLLALVVLYGRLRSGIAAGLLSVFSSWVVIVVVALLYLASQRGS